MLPPSRIALNLVLVLCVGLFLHFYIRAYHQETHAQQTARNLIANVCNDAERTIQSGLVDRCHEARHRVQDAVWRTALVTLIVPEGGRAWIFLDAIVFGTLVLFVGIVICTLRGFEDGPQFMGALLPEADIGARAEQRQWARR